MAKIYQFLQGKEIQAKLKKSRSLKTKKDIKKSGLVAKIDIKFTEANAKNMPKGAIPALEQEILKKFKSQYPDINVQTRKSSYTDIGISGVKDDEKKSIMEKLEEIWFDDSWLPG